MKAVIPYELISKIIEYVSDSIGFDFKYNRYMKTWRFLFNKCNKAKNAINDLITKRWCIRKFYDMTNPVNKKLETLYNFKQNGALYYASPTNPNDINIKISIFTNIDNITIISLYSKKYSVENLIYKFLIK
jgi:hypothetical protein